MALALSASKIIGLVLLGLLGLLYVFQGSLLYFPDARKFEDCRRIKKYGGEAVELIRGDESLRYYAKTKEGAKAWLVHAHGNGGNACDRLYLLDGLGDLPLNFVFWEYPGYAGGKGRNSQDSFLKNIRSLYELLKEDQDLPVILYGESLGSGSVTHLASQVEVAGLILQAPYTSIAKVGQYHYPFLPVRWMARDPFPAELWAKEVKAPVLAFQGLDDEVIPIEIGREQVKNFRGVNKFLELPGVHHNDIFLREELQVYREIKTFVCRLLDC